MQASPYERKYALMHVNALATDHAEDCVIFYEPSTFTAADIMYFPTSVQHHYVRTPQGMECRVCKVHGNNDCTAKATFCVEVGGKPCVHDPKCIVTPSSDGKMEHTCSIHSIGDVCFALANYKPRPQPPQPTPAKPPLTTLTSSDFINTFSVNIHHTNKLRKVLFALDHFYTTNHKSVALLCGDVWDKFRKNGENFEEFIYAEITPMFNESFHLQVEAQCRLTNLWQRVERKGCPPQCMIDNCPCRLIES